MEWSTDPESMDIKIGAVFSLAQEEEVSSNPETTPTFQPAIQETEINDVIPAVQPITTTADKGIDTMPTLNASTTEDSDDEEEYFIPFGQSEPEPIRSSETSSNKSRNMNNLERSPNESTDSAASDVLNGDCPPSLSLELAPPGWTGGVYGEEDMLPPVLERERTEDVGSQISGDGTQEQDGIAKSPTKRKCTKISPSYLVLTNLRRFLDKNDKRVSWRRFKRRFKECSNMCKKVYFRRRLAAGKDVFNVLTPSKQKLYQLFLDKQEFGNQKEDDTAGAAGKADKKSPKLEKKTLNFPKLLALYDQMKEKELKASGMRSSAAKKRRQIQHVPKDFTRKLTGDEQEDEMTMKKMTQDEQERERKEKLQKYLHNRELANLKSQIKMKRVANKRMKKFKKPEIEKKTFIDFVTGTSMKGRKRKGTTKYGPEFALTKTHEDQFVTLAMFEKRMKQMEKEQIRRKEKMDGIKRRMSGQDIDLVIDNPEKKNVKKIRLEAGDFHLGVKAKDRNNDKVPDKLETGAINESGKKLTSRSSKKQRSGSTGPSRDGVLIRDVPSDANFISGILGDSDDVDPPFSQAQRPAVNPAAEATEGESSDTYPYARSLLNTSSFSKTGTQSRNDAKTLQAKFSNPNVIRMTHEMEMDRVKKLRIPETVQKLFKVKTEPIDPDDAVNQDLQRQQGQESQSVRSFTTATSAHSTVTKYSSASEKSLKICTEAFGAITTQALEKRNYTMIPSSLAGSLNTTPLKTMSPKKTVALPSLIRQPGSSIGSPPILPKSGASTLPITFVNGDKRIKVLVSAGNVVPSNQPIQAQCCKAQNLITNFPVTCFSQSSAVSKPGVVTVMYPTASSSTSPVVSRQSTMTVMYPTMSSTTSPVVSRQGAMTVMYPSVSSSSSKVVSNQGVMTVMYPPISSSVSSVSCATNKLSGVFTSYTHPQHPQGLVLMTPSAQGQSRPSISSSTQSQATTSLLTTNTSQVTSQTANRHPNPQSLAKQVVTMTNIPSVKPSPVQARPIVTTIPTSSTPQPRTQVPSAAMATSQPLKNVSVTEKCKFYLLKVDGKNILIPINPGQSGTPTAFVVGNDVALKAAIKPTAGATGQTGGASTQSTANSEQQPTAKISKLPIPKIPASVQHVTQPLTNAVPLLRLASPGKTTSTLLKPMATIIPNIKPAVRPEIASAKVPQMATTKVSSVSQYVYPPKGVKTSVNSDSGVKTVARENENTSSSSMKLASAGVQNQFSIKDLFSDAGASSGKQSEYQTLPEKTVYAALSALSTDSTKAPTEISSYNVTSACGSSEDIGEKGVENDAGNETVVGYQGKETMVGEERDEEEEEEKDDGEDDIGEGDSVARKKESSKHGDEASNSGKSREDANSVKPFTEGITAREDRLRKLKELLREKQKAVDEIRATRVKESND